VEGRRAFAELEIARGLEPGNASYWTVRGQLSFQAGRLEEAREAYREAQRLSVDNEFAQQRLLEACTTSAERRQMLAFIKEELIQRSKPVRARSAAGQHDEVPRDLAGPGSRPRR
jgi:cytochrome c-type biogenesis protein CcmH/NrfG